MTDAIVIIATIVAADGQAAAVERALRAAVTEVRTEEGCERYELNRDTGQPGVFVMVERWSDRAALDRHAGAPALAALGQAIQGIATLSIQELTQLV